MTVVGGQTSALQLGGDPVGAQPALERVPGGGDGRQPQREQPGYEIAFKKTSDRCRSEEARGMLPERLAADLEPIVRASPASLRFRYSAGPLFQRLLFALAGIFPDSLAERAISAMYLK